MGKPVMWWERRKAEAGEVLTGFTGFTGLGRDGGGKTTGTKVGSMAWNFSEISLPWRGKMANLTSMPWKIAEFDFHCVELFAVQGETTTPGKGDCRSAGILPAMAGGKRTGGGGASEEVPTEQFQQ